jgi:hypothetical protein
MMNALVKLKTLTTCRSSSEPDVELQLTAYAERLSAWPIETVERVLGEWPTRSQWWPAWLELQEQLPAPGADVPRIRAPGSGAETFCDRVARLSLNGRLGRIGVGQWKVVMDRHRSLTDRELLDAVERLEAGRAAFQGGWAA